MRSISPAALAGVLVLLVSCREAQPVAYAETAVDYAVSIQLAARTAGISLEGVPSFSRAERPVQTSGVVRIGIVSEEEYDPEEPSYRPANVQELIAFTAQHPAIVADRNGVCASGTRLAIDDGRPVFPVVSRRNGQAFGGLWSNCRWQLVVLST